MRAPEFWRADGGGLWPAVLQPAASVWGAVTRLRRQLTVPVRAALPVICIGNLVAGGAGKTPTAIAVAHHLQIGGRRVHLLTRGYGGSLAGPLRVDPRRHNHRQVGDEALLLANVAPTWVARDRPAGAACAAAAGADVLVMDDGFQNPSLAKDLSLLVIDAGFGIGNGRMLPAGPLREPVADGLARAQAVVLIGDRPGGPELPDLGGLPVLQARMVPGPEAERLAGRRVFAFAGIARPEKFFRTLRDAGVEIVGTRSFADHHVYNADQVMRLVEAASQAGAVPVTTRKDWVRLPAAAQPMIEVLSAELQFAELRALDRLLSGLRSHRPGRET